MNFHQNKIENKPRIGGLQLNNSNFPREFKGTNKQKLFFHIYLFNWVCWLMWVTDIIITVHFLISMKYILNKRLS